MADYWNHNTAYHAELLDAVPPSGGDVLDIGCGDGLLVEKLATKATKVIGLDPDPAAISQARRRLADTPNAAQAGWPSVHRRLVGKQDDLGLDRVRGASAPHPVAEQAPRRIGQSRHERRTPVGIAR